MLKRKDLQNIFLWFIFVSLGIAAFVDFYMINIQTYIAPQYLWHSLRFVTFLSFFIIFFVFSTVLFIVLIKRKFSLIPLNKKYFPDWFAYIITGLLIIMPILVKWVIPLPETIEIGFWTGLFMTYYSALAGGWFFQQQVFSEKNNLFIKIFLSLLVLCYIAFFIFTLAYFRLPLGDDVLGQFMNSASLYLDDPDLRQIGEQITDFSMLIKNAILYYNTFGSRMIGAVLEPFLSIFGQFLTASLTTASFIGIILLIVKNIYINDNPLTHPIPILLCFLILFYFEPAAGKLLMWTIASIYVVSVLLLLAFLTSLRQLIDLESANKEKGLKFTSYLFINVLGFITGITHEVYSLIIFFVSVLLIMVAVIRNQKGKRLFLLIIGLGLGMAAHFLAPGNYVRLANSHDAVAFARPLLDRMEDSLTMFIVFSFTQIKIYSLIFLPFLFILYFKQLVQRIRAHTAPAVEDVLLLAAIAMVLVWGVLPYVPGYARIGFMSLLSIVLLITWEKAGLLNRFHVDQWRHYISFYLVIAIVFTLLLSDMPWLMQFREYSVDWRGKIEQAKSEHLEVVYVPKFPDEISQPYTMHNYNNKSDYESDSYRRYYGILIVPE